MRIGLHFWLFLLRKKGARKAQASPFDIKTALAGRTLTPMPPPDGRLTAELRHKSENAHRRSHLLRSMGRVVPTCAVLWADHASVQVCATQTPRPPTVRRKKAREMIHDSITQPSITRKISSASAVCTRYHGRNAVSISTRYTSGMDSLSFIAIRISKSSS